MKCISPYSLRLLPYLIFQASAPFSKASALLATSGILANRASCTKCTGFKTHHIRKHYRFARCYCRLRKYISESESTRLKSKRSLYTEVTMIANTTFDSIISTTGNSLPSSPYTGASLTLCPKCHGEGKLSKIPSKKARLREQRRIYQQKQEQDKQETIQHDNHKRIKRSSPLPTSSRTTPLGSSGDTKNNKKANSRESKLPILPRRWEACPNCDQTGLLIPLNISSIGSSSSSSVTATQHRPFVAIIGGGIGGVALAVALRHRGIPFMVYEKDSRFDQRRQGYGLTLQQARRALQALGIFENNDDGRNISSRSGRLLQEHAVTSTKHVVHTPDGKQVGEWGLRRWVGDSYSAKNGGENSGENGSSSCKEDRISDALGCDRTIENAKMTDIEDSTEKARSTTSSRTKLRSTRTKNKKRRQNLHVPRQTLRYALLEALKEASLLAIDDDDSEGTEATNAKKLSDNDHANLDISWGHKLVSIQPVKGGSGTNGVELSFEVADENENGKRVVNSHPSLVVGCDGIRSSVREQLLQTNIGSNGKFNEMKDIKQSDASLTALRYLDCVVILGICPLGDLFPQGAEDERERLIQQQKRKQIELSPLLDGETVFQTADGTTRIYLMPYSKKKNEYMWQLSFPVPDEEYAIALSRRGSKALKEEALRRCQFWHVPIPEILKATPIELVSGYPVYDRDILTSDTLSDARSEMLTTNDSSDAACSLPITLLGDAAHPMSPFKGQGANQALLDALSLARALYRIHCREGQSLEAALEYYENEMLVRSAEKVRASSAAARFLHTDIAIQEGDVTRGAAFNSSSSAINESRA